MSENANRSTTHEPNWADDPVLHLLRKADQALDQGDLTAARAALDEAGHVDDNATPGSSTDGVVVAHTMALMMAWSHYRRQERDEA